MNKIFGVMLILISLYSVAQAEDDIFLVIGQSNMRGKGPVDQPPTILPVEGSAYEYNGTPYSISPLGNNSYLRSGQTGVPTADCGSPCYWTSNYYSSLLAFAKTWKEKTRHGSFYVIRPKGGTGLVSAGNIQNGYWLNFTDSLYLNALNDYIKGYRTINNGMLQGSHHRYVLWVQGENDIIKGVSTESYLNGLTLLFNKLNADVQASGVPAFQCLFIANTGYFHNTDAYSPIDSLQVHKAKVQAILDAQNAAGTKGNIVLVSKKAPIYMSPCINSSPGQSPPYSSDCGSIDLIHYKTSVYEKLGIEMATNAALFDQFGIKPYDPSSCQVNPSLCSPSVSVYRWNNGVDHATGINSTDFDTQRAYAFKGIRYLLFKDQAPGRIPLYRKFNPATLDYMESVTSTEDTGYQDASLLGYCYSSPGSNASIAIKRLKKLDSKGVIINRITSIDPVEIDLLIKGGFVYEDVLCYTN